MTDILLPKIFFLSFCFNSRIELLFNFILPFSISAFSGIKFIIEETMVDFPQPLSPIIPTTLFVGILIFIFLNACSFPYQLNNLQINFQYLKYHSYQFIYFLSLGSIISLNLSPKKVNPIVVIINGNPPAINGQGELSINE